MSDSNQSRQPKDLEGLLKFCMQVTKDEDAPENVQMDPERQKWLEEAIAGMTVDVIKQLTMGIKIISMDKVFDPDTDDDALEDVEEAFEAILDWTGNIDMANNFHKIGGFEVLKKLLTQSPHAMVRMNTSDVVAELSQNNPYCQKHFVDDGFIPILIDLMEKDKAENVRVKCLYAISSIVRDNPDGLKAFVQGGGPSSLLISIQSSESSRLRTKACFFLSSIACNNEEIKKMFSEMGFARQLIVLLQLEEHKQSHEHIAKALLTLLKDDLEVQKECRDSEELNFKVLIDSRKELLKNKEEFQEEYEYFLEMEKMCFKLQPKLNSVDR